MSRAGDSRTSSMFSYRRRPEYGSCCRVAAWNGRSQGMHHLVDHRVRHLAVDVAGQFDEPRLDAELLGLPGQIERIDRNAVPAQAGAGVKGMKPNGFVAAASSLKFLIFD